MLRARKDAFARAAVSLMEDLFMEDLEILHASSTSTPTASGRPRITTTDAVAWRGKGSFQPIISNGSTDALPVLNMGERIAFLKGRAYLPMSAATTAALQGTAFRLRVVRTGEVFTPVREAMDMSGQGFLWRIDLGDTV